MEGDLSAGEMVRLWEQCAPLHPIDRGLTLLAALRPERSYRQWAALSIGRRDARLLALRRSGLHPGLSGGGRYQKSTGRYRAGGQGGLHRQREM